MDRSESFGVGIMAGMIIALIIDVVIGSPRQERHLHKEAVEHNAGQWVLDGEPPDADFIFKWNDELENESLDSQSD